MKIKVFLIVSLGLALLITLISVIAGKLMAPGVYLTVGGGLLGVELRPEIQRYIVQVFLSFFVCAYLACFLSDRWLGKRRE